MNIEIIEQTPEEGKVIFDNHMHRDFPENEIKPWNIALELYRRGIYEMLQILSDGIMVGYVWMVCPSGEAALIDYLAVLPEYRSEGYGSRILKALVERYRLRGMELLLESEYPDEAPDRAMAIRRLGFYKRAGFKNSGVEVRLFGVHFCILTFGKEGNARQKMEHLYRAMFPERLYRHAVEFLT